MLFRFNLKIRDLGCRPRTYSYAIFVFVEQAEVNAEQISTRGPIATPAVIAFATALATTRSGKIMRRYLKAKETGQESGDISALEQ